MRALGLVVGALVGCGRIDFTARPDPDAVADSAGCPLDYVAVGSLTHRYSPLQTGQIWSDAASACETMGAYLTIIDDNTELDAIVGVVGSSAWIGITDAAVEGTWLTVRGQPATFLPWNPGQPDNVGGNENCGELAVTGFNDKTCSEVHGFVCECEP